jgi:hypothetical protein
MSDPKGRKPPDYEIGYRRPPRATQFAAGKSGNPRGRPKGSRPIGSIIQGVFHKKITVTENGKTRRISTLEVVFRRLSNDAMRGDPGAIKLSLSLMERYGDAPESSIELGALLAEDRAILAEYSLKPVEDVVGPAPDADDQGADEDGD